MIIRPCSRRFSSPATFSAAEALFSAAAGIFSAAADPTLCVRRTLRLTLPAAQIPPFRRRNPPRPADPIPAFCPCRS